MAEDNAVHIVKSDDKGFGVYFNDSTYADKTLVSGVDTDEFGCNLNVNWKTVVTDKASWDAYTTLPVTFGWHPGYNEKMYSYIVDSGEVDADGWSYFFRKYTDGLFEAWGVNVASDGPWTAKKKVTDTYRNGWDSTFLSFTRTFSTGLNTLFPGATIYRMDYSVTDTLPARLNTRPTFIDNGDGTITAGYFFANNTGSNTGSLTVTALTSNLYVCGKAVS